MAPDTHKKPSRKVGKNEVYPGIIEVHWACWPAITIVGCILGRRIICMNLVAAVLLVAKLS
jgi:hypothetical protein